MQPPFYNLKVSSLGVIPKKKNYFIPAELCSVHYVSVDDAVKIIKLIGPQCHLAKTYVGSAFCIIHVNPADCYLLGMH